MNNRIIAITVILAVLAISATAITAYKLGYEQGFDGCIEENNLYDKYK